MQAAASAQLTKKQVRSLQSLVGGHVIRVSEYTASPQPSARFIACSAPFLACKNSIMHDDGGLARCNSPFVHCKRYHFNGELRIEAANAEAPCGSNRKVACG